MSAPLIWVALPLVAAVGFWLIRRRYRLMIGLATILCLLLAVLAWLVPFNAPIQIGPLALRINAALNLAGRQLVLENNDRVFLAVIYLLCAVWFAGSRAGGANLLLVPFGIGIVALLVAARAVEPFLYAALLIEMAVLLAVPMLAPPGHPVGQGVLRFLIFQTLAMPFILLAGWALGGVEENPSNELLVTLASAFLALGFAFWLAVFPFYTWVPLLAEQASPYVTGFVFLIFPTANLLLGLNFLERFGWLRAMPNFYTVIAQIGALMVLTAGLWAAFQNDLARIFGYAVIIETGFSLLAVGLGSQAGLTLFTSMFLPRLLALAMWALSLAVLLQNAPSTRFEDVKHLSQQVPFASAGLAAASLTLAGLPILAVFPIHQVLLEQIARQSLSIAIVTLTGSVGMMFAAFRALVIIAPGGPSFDKVRETRLQIALLSAGVIGLVLIGLFPQIFLPLMDGLVSGIRMLP